MLQKNKSKTGRRKSAGNSEVSGLPPNNIGDVNQFRAPSSVSFPLNLVGLPDRLGVVLKYCESYTFSGSATPAAQVWALNSPNDPNLTGVGHQPSFYDTLQAVYGRYFVESFKLEVEVSNHTSTVSLFGSLNYSDINVSANTVEALSEAHYSKPFALAAQNAGGSTKTIKLPWMSSRQLMGSKYLEGDDNMYAAVTNNPGDLAFGILKLSADDVTTTIVALAKVTIYMRIYFKDLTPLVSS